MEASDGWIRETTDDLLRSARVQLDPNQLRPLRVRIMGTLARAVPRPEQALVEGAQGTARLHALHERALYTFDLHLGGDDLTGETTTYVQRIDLRRVVRVSVSETQGFRDGQEKLESTWRFEFEHGNPFELVADEIMPDDSPPRERYRFGKAVAVAAGWGADPDAP